MKRITALLLLLAVLCAPLCGCGQNLSHGGKRIVCTIFPLYDWMRELTAGADGVETVLVADNGVDMHSYQPTTGDIVDISTCDMLVYIGGDSDRWVEETALRSGSEKMTRLPLLELMGEDALCAAPHDHHDEEHHHHHGEDAKDEHLWLSPSAALKLCALLTNELCVMDEANASVYRANFESYSARLEELDRNYRTAAEESRRDMLLFADRFPFRYLADDYSLEYSAAFDGCEAETEAGFETVTRLAARLDDHDLGCVLIIDGSRPDLARTIIAASDSPGAEILTLDSMQSVSGEDIAGGVTYLSIMEENLNVLRQALGC